MYESSDLGSIDIEMQNVELDLPSLQSMCICLAFAHALTVCMFVSYLFGHNLQVWRNLLVLSLFGTFSPMGSKVLITSIGSTRKYWGKATRCYEWRVTVPLQ